MRERAGKLNTDRLRYGHRPPHAGFTLIELLVAIAIISLLSAAMLVALTELQAQSKLRRCQQQIKKIDQLIMRRWDEILHKPLPIQLSPLNAKPTAQEIQARKLQVLIARRELLRLEMPERITDISDAPVLFPGGYVMPLPATTSTFRRKAMFNASLGNVWTEQHQGAECLYLILSVMQDQDSSGLDFFFPSEIGDTDNDGMPEILDGFDQPIGFLRWAPGISSRVGMDYRWGSAGTDDDGNDSTDDGSEAGYGDDYRSFSDIQKVSAAESPDATDMGAADYRLYDNNASNDPYNLFPLIMSAGRDGSFGTYGFGKTPNVSEFYYLNPKKKKLGFSYLDKKIIDGDGVRFPSDPYWSMNVGHVGLAFGAPINDTILDNISNHQIEVNP